MEKEPSTAVLEKSLMWMSEKSLKSIWSRVEGKKIGTIFDFQKILRCPLLYLLTTTGRLQKCLTLVRNFNCHNKREKYYRKFQSFTEKCKHWETTSDDNDFTTKYIYSFIYLIYLFVYWFINYLFIYLLNYLFIYLFICLFVYFYWQTLHIKLQ